MNTHENIEELADLATAGAWEPDAHATSCGSCTAAIADARAFQRWTSGLLSSDAPPSDLEERLIKAFRATGTAAVRRFRLLPGKRLLKWAAGVAALVGVVALGSAFAPSDDLKSLASVEHDFLSNDHDGYLALPAAGGLTGARALSLGDELSLHSWGMFADGKQPVVHNGRIHGYSGIAGDLRVDGAHTEGKVPKLGEAPVLGFLFGGKETSRFKLDSGIIDEPTGEIGEGNSAKGLAQIQELTKNVEEHRTKLGRGTAEKATAVAEVEYARQQGQRLSEKLARLEDKSVEGGRDKRFLEEKLNALGVAGAAPEPPKPTPPPLRFVLDEPQVSTLAAAYEKVPERAQDNRKLIRTAKLAVEVDTYEAAQTKVAAAAAEEKGYVASADTERLQNGKIRATVTLRVPPDRFEALLGKLRVLGTVKHQTLATDDVGKSYFDMEARMGAKQALLDRLKKVLAEAKGSVKELMDVEIQMGATLEQIESLKGELKYLDNQVSLATITLELAEKDLGQPFEYVQTLQSRIGLVTSDVDAAYAAAQKAVVDAGGQVVDSKMTRQNDGAATGTIRARVEAAKFPDVRQALRALGHVETDTVDQQKSARGGAPTASAPVRVEQATIDFSVTTPALLISRNAQVIVETKGVEAAYQAARQAAEAAGGRILDGGLSNSTAGGVATLTVQVDVAKFADLLALFRGSGEVKYAVVNQSAGVLAVPVRERAQLNLQLKSPPALIGEEQGLGRIVRDTFARSWGGLLWSVEKLFVGLSLAGPWALALGIGWLLWRRARRRKAPAAQ